MMAPRRPRDIGTAAESSVVKYLREHGFPHAERRSLRGINDAGDITGTPGICWEIKAGDRARNASDQQIVTWLWETETERHNANADYGILVVARFRKNVADWWAIMWGTNFVKLYASLYQIPAIDFPVRTTLKNIVYLIRADGYGQPHELEEDTA